MISLFRTLAALLLLAGGALASAPSVTPMTPSIAGFVHDANGLPIPGASVAVIDSSGAVITGVATDPAGRFGLRVDLKRPGLSLRVTSIGYLPAEQALEHGTDLLSIELKTTAIDLGTVAVTPKLELEPANLTLNAHRLAARARQSLVPTNPVGAIRNVDIARAGSSHSSQLRIHGTSPVYYFNDTPIGTDPDHYGMFTILPSTMVDQIELEAHGTSAEHAVSSVVRMQSPERFRQHQSLDLNLSTIEATGTYSIGSEKMFAMGALRKSVLDKLVTYFEVTDDRRTLPPTNFQDIAIVSGWKIAPNTRLLFDQYHANDYLSYRVESKRDNGMVDTYQHASDHFYSLRGQHLFNDALLELSLAMRRSFEWYDASPAEDPNDDRLRLDLSEERKATLLGAKARFAAHEIAWTVGSRTSWTTNRTIHLEQNNWNFLPPFAASDNPYIYQPALNFDYGAYHDRAAETSHALFVSGEREIGSVKIESGLRGEYHTALAQKSDLLFRSSVEIRVDDKTSVRLYAGTFAEHPVSHVLESYQVLVHDQLYNLAPIRSRLLSATVSRGPVSFTVFDKRQENLPVVTPNFDLTGQAVDPEDESLQLLQAGSTGSAHFRGLSVAYEDEAWFNPDVTLGLAYAYTDASQVEFGVTMPHDMHSPHRLMAQAEYRWKPGVTIGGELQIRSGYPYTESKDYKTSYEEGDLTPKWYQSQLSYENRERFPANVSLNLFFSASVGRGGEIYGSIANATNRDNPIINTSSGYILDSGILPTVGLRFRF